MNATVDWIGSALVAVAVVVVGLACGALLVGLLLALALWDVITGAWPERTDE